MKKALLIPLMLAMTLYALPVLAVPLLINFQGNLTDSTGLPIGNSANVTADVTFNIYDVETGGVSLWTETHFAADGEAVTVSKGIFNVLIGSGTPDPANTGNLSSVLTGEDRWLAVQIGSDPEMTPRQQITSVAYSIRSNSAANADDVLGKDINPQSVTIGGTLPVIDSNGQWVGDPTGLIGPKDPLVIQAQQE